MPRTLKPLRVAVALVFFLGLTAAFVDFRGLVPRAVAEQLAALQATPALLAALGGGLGAALVLGALVMLTLLGGRIYCSTLCPLGVLQDVVNRLASRARKHPLRHAPARNWLRYGVLGAAGLAALLGFTALTVTIIDPYAHFGRIVSGVFRPLLVTANNAAVPLAEQTGLHALYRVDLPSPAFAVIAFSAATLLVIAGLAAWRGRLFCNTFCPVGTVLGLLSRAGVYRIAIDRSACTKCAQCLRACKAQCIDLRTGQVDASRCVACYNCVGACDHSGIGYRLAWSLPKASATAQPADPQRRALLTGALLLGPAVTLRAAETLNPPQPATVVAPPGAGNIARLLDRCTACQLCVSACPTHVLQPALFHYGWQGFAKPRLDFESSFCNFECRACGEVCPTDAISLLDLAEKKRTSLGIAHFDQKLCIVDVDGTDCAACSEHCPTKAVDTVPFRDNLRLPRVQEDLCIGCGACEFACPVRPVRAIRVAGRSTHVQAREPVNAAPAPAARAATDFPF